jgi:hypothetical protein
MSMIDNPGEQFTKQLDEAMSHGSGPKAARLLWRVWAQYQAAAAQSRGLPVRGRSRSKPTSIEYYL